MAGVRDEDQSKRSSLGRMAYVGELYDVRSDRLSCMSLFRETFPQNLVKRTDVDQMEFKYKFTENFSGRLELFDVQKEFQLSCLLGLVRVEGSWKFLRDEKESERTVSCSVLCQVQTLNEKVFLSLNDIVHHFDPLLLQDPKFTHVIGEINWGVNCVLNLEFACTSEPAKRYFQELLAEELSILKGVPLKGGGKLEKTGLDFLRGKDVRIKVFADVVPEDGWPTTVDGFFQFLEQVPRFLSKVNEGKGKPLSYTLIPLSSLRCLLQMNLAVDVVVPENDENFSVSTICFFEEIDQTKKKLHDWCQTLNESKKFVKEEDLREAEKKKAHLELKESELKSLVSEDWLAVRSGRKSLKDLIERMEEFKSQELNLFSYEEYLDSCSAVLRKLSFVSQVLSEGILYLGKGESFRSVQSKHLPCEFIVFVTSSEIEKADPELHRNTLWYFRTLFSEQIAGTKYMVVDLDLTDEDTFKGSKVTVAKCFRVRGIQVVSQDLFAEYMEELNSNFARVSHSSKIERSRYRPGNRVTLEIPCPGFQAGTCSSDVVMWKCATCKNNIQYGFDEFYYCSCGRSHVKGVEYRCSDPKHGGPFIPADVDSLKNDLAKLRPLREMNVLVIGQSGVGKSTWINSIVNYLSYDSFEEAKNHGVICTIPGRFTIYDPNTYEKHEVVIGEESENEVTASGSSATQFVRSYSFLWEGTCVRIIDTPGLGDIRGIDQDKKNLRSIVDHLGYLKELHGVCILLKASDNRFNAIYTYCIKELLAHLHRSVIRNIVFCFTNSRTALYSPGQSSAVLQKVIQGLGIEEELSLGQHNMFSLDNEAFLFLCASAQTNIEHGEVISSSFVESWKISLRETQRLLRAIKTFEPHLVKETLSLGSTRIRILNLTKPIAEVTKTVQMNMMALEKKKRELQTSKMTIQKLQSKLQLNIIQLESVPLDLPRTVCTSPSCVEYLTYKCLDVSEILYKTHCHSPCYLKNVTPKTVNNERLKKCTAMQRSSNCHICGCTWDKHMHLTYDQIRVEKTVENRSVKEDMTKELTQYASLEKFVDSLESLIEKYKREQEIIVNTSVKFGVFLKKNAITVYNDSVAEYLEYLIDEETKKPHKSTSDKWLLEHLKQTLEHYQTEVQIFQNVLKENEGSAEVITPEQIHQLEQDLYSLELTGKQIKQSVELSRSATLAAPKCTEVSLDVSNKRRTSVLTPPTSSRGRGEKLLSKWKFWGKPPS